MTDWSNHPLYESDDIGEILRNVQTGDFVGPRGAKPLLDRALEAACLKAIVTKPEDRHRSCRACGEDMERWIANEPVSTSAEFRTRNCCAG